MSHRRHDMWYHKCGIQGQTYESHFSERPCFLQLSNAPVAPAQQVNRLNQGIEGRAKGGVSDFSR